MKRWLGSGLMAACAVFGERGQAQPARVSHETAAPAPQPWVLAGTVAPADTVRLPEARALTAAAPADRAAVARPSPEQVDRAQVSLAGERLDLAGYRHWFTSLTLGRGLRFNNPFRLATVLGEDEQSLSLTATYADLSAGVTIGDPNGLQHGAALSWSVALEGIQQQVLTPAYVALYRLPAPFSLTARFGVPIVLTPDPSAGLELGVGGVWRVLAALGLRAELLGDLFFGAATPDRSRTVVPVLAFQLGVWGEFEELP